MYTYPEALNAMEAIATDLFKRAWPNRRADVRVVADPMTGTASVDWKNPYGGENDRYGLTYVTINMPVKPATYRMSAEEFDHWAAYVLHEVGHPLHTDKDVWKRAVEAGEHRLLNALEDVREEKATLDLGLAINATEVFSKLISSLHAKGTGKGYDPNMPQSIGWTLSYLGRAANGYDLDTSLVLKNLDPKGVVASILPWALADLAACTSTQECWDLSKRIIKAVNDAMPKAPAKPEAPQKPDQPTGEGSEAPEAPQGDIPIMPEPPQGGQNETRGEPEPKPEGDAGEDEDEDEDKPAQQGTGRGDPTSRPKAPGTPAQPKAEEEPKPFSDKDVDETSMQPNDRDELPTSTIKSVAAAQVIGVLRRVAKYKVPDADITGRDMGGSVERTGASAAKMGQQRQLLARALKRNEEDSFDHGRPTGRLNGRDLAKVAVRDGNVFGKRHVTEGYDTDVQILVDGSGSMSGRSMQAAATLALVVAQAASQVGVSCTAHVFNDHGLYAATRGRAKPKANKFAYMHNKVMGGTPLTENLLRACKLQKERAAGKRRIMFVITDGGCNSGPEVVKAAGEYMERIEGVEIANLHIGYAVMGLFRNEAAVNVDKVSQTGLRQLTGLLEKGV